MNLRHLLGATLASALVASAVPPMPAVAESDPAPKAETKPGGKADPAPSTPEVSHKLRGGKLFKPWSELTTLSDAQRSKIHDIHLGYLKQERELKDKEDTEIRALLSEEQKKELADREAKDKADKKIKSAEKREEMKEEIKEGKRAIKERETKEKGDRPAGDKATGDKTTGDKTSGDKASGDKSASLKAAGDSPTGPGR